MSQVCEDRRPPIYAPPGKAAAEGLPATAVRRSPPASDTMDVCARDTEYPWASRRLAPPV
ncbi:hypothetical protein GCM10023257_28060 [Streptomyces hyderabadensis]|uniref:Uncharacterized protein n=1 Tax=Streptomyces hyderabadensis TaxID=598549 RepID=A0ABP9I363_9ACTN